MIKKHFMRLMSVAVLLLTGMSLFANGAASDDLQEYLDNLAAKGAAKVKGQSGAAQARRAQSVVIPVDIPVVDLSQFTSAQNRTTTLEVKTDVKFTNGTISSHTDFSGGGGLMYVSNGATVVIDATASVNAMNVAPSNCLRAIGVFGGSNVTQYGDIKAPEQGNGCAVYLETKADTYTYVSGVTKGAIWKGYSESSEFAGYTGRTWMVGQFDPISYSFADINAAMKSDMVKEGDILLVDHRTYDSGVAQTVTKSVKIVANNYNIPSVYDVYGARGAESRQQTTRVAYLAGDLNIEAPHVTVDGLETADINVRDEYARIEHCYVRGSILGDDNYECDGAYINSNYITGEVVQGAASDWSVYSSYPSEKYTSRPYDMPVFKTISVTSNVITDNPVSVSYLIKNVSSLKKVEYFWDEDYGWNKCKPLRNANNQYVTDATTAPLSIPTNGVTVGSHKLVVRAESGSGYWVTSVHDVRINAATIVPKPEFMKVDIPQQGVNYNYSIAFHVAAEGGKIDWVEYFWDKDPGLKKGTVIVKDNSQDIGSGIIITNYKIDCEGLTGSHTLFLRAFCGDEQKLYYTKEIQLSGPKPVFTMYEFPSSGYNNNYRISFTVAAEGGKIDWVEYYWDQDPGDKNAHVIIKSSSQYSGAGVTMSDYQIDASGLTGRHTLFLRAFCGQEKATVYIKEILLSAPSVVVPIDADDLAALKLISDNLHMDGYWYFGNNGLQEKDFPGVTFVDHRVTEINLQNHAFTGELSKSWMPKLPELTYLNLSRNNISGDLTYLVYRMPKLRTLDVSYNRIMQVSGELPKTISSLNLTSQMRTFTNGGSSSNDGFITEFLTGAVAPVDAKLGAAVSLSLPSVFRYDFSQNTNTLRADIQVVDINKPSNIYGTYSYDTEKNSWKFTPQLSSGLTIADEMPVALVSTGKYQRWTACPAKLNVVLGDANIDGSVNVLDVQHTLNYILATAQPFNLWAANTYDDKLINVQDIVCTVNIMLGLPNKARMADMARGASAETADDAQCWVYEENNRIIMAPATDVAAVDIEIDGVTTDEVSLLLNHKQFQMIGQNTSTGSRYVIFSPTGSTIPTGKLSALLSMSHSGQPAAVDCADTRACRVATTIGNTTGIQEVQSWQGEQAVIETRLAPGIYIVRTEGKNGERKTVKIIKK